MYVLNKTLISNAKVYLLISMNKDNLHDLLMRVSRSGNLQCFFFSIGRAGNAGKVDEEGRGEREGVDGKV